MAINRSETLHHMPLADARCFSSEIAAVTLHENFKPKMTDLIDFLLSNSGLHLSKLMQRIVTHLAYASIQCESGEGLHSRDKSTYEIHTCWHAATLHTAWGMPSLREL